jgi:hypothetical protein
MAIMKRNYIYTCCCRLDEIRDNTDIYQRQTTTSVSLILVSHNQSGVMA